MSHFVVAVITDKKENLEDMLEPYDENKEVEKYIDEYGEETTYNPLSKYDWYEIGGRWHNEILVKEEVEDIIGGSASWGNKSSNAKEVPTGYRWCDGARIKDIEFQKQIDFEETKKKAERFWNIYIEGATPENEEEQKMIDFTIYKREYYIERYSTKENYVKQECKFNVWALLDEDGWHEKGKMGWWAMNDSTKESEELFLDKVQEVLNKEENQEKYLIMVDCHI